MFSFLGQLVPKRRGQTLVEDDDVPADVGSLFIPPAPLVAEPEVFEEPPASAVPEPYGPVDVRSDEQRAADAELAEAQRVAEARLAARRAAELEFERERIADQQRRDEARHEAAAAAAAEAAAAEAERLEAERLEAERLEAERLEAERLTAEPAEIALRHTWPATLLHHEEAMQYGESARRNLISTIVELHDVKLGAVLHDALYEEQPDGLRPDVLSALRRSYHDETLRETYARFTRIGNEREREIARDGLAALDS